MTQKKFRRKKYVVDRDLQFAVAAQLLGVLGGVAVLYGVGLYLLTGGDRAGELTAQEVLRANLIYFLLAVAILVVVSLLLTHRIAGPAFVLERALRAMLRRDYSARIHLRRRDYLKPLAASVEELRVELERRREILDAVRDALEEGSVEKARAAFDRLDHVAEQAREPATP